MSEGLKMAFVLPKSELRRVIDELSKDYRVFRPVAKGSEFVFDEEGEPAMDYDTTILPPKKAFLPPEETMFTFKRETFHVEEVTDEKPVAVVGIHPCDLRALHLLDKVFTGEFVDPYYMRRRQSGFVVAINCVKPCEHGFCTSFDSGPGAKEGYDLLLTDLGDKYLVEVGSDRGKSFVDRLGLDSASSADVEKAKELVEEAARSMARRIDTHGLVELLRMRIEHQHWAELEARCLSCGLCNVVCPTCYCYNVVDKLDLGLNEGARIRTWDSCLLLEFAEVALGGNFRRERSARIRQRILHKLLHFVDQYGEFGCVGCGRCVKYCIKKIDPVEIVEVLRGGA